MRRKTTEEFIEQSRKIHGDKYDYSKVEYKGSNIKVCIICPKHGEFFVTPANHLNGRECPKCGHNKAWGTRGRITTKDFIKKARKIHGDKYDYSKVEYHKATEKVCIICPQHGEFWITPNAHLNGQGCRYCTGLKFNKKIFVEKSNKIYNEKYNYSKVVYSNNHTKVCIICPEHGEFWQTPMQHLRGHGCPKCRNGHHKLDIDELLEKFKSAHGDKYTYDNLFFKNMATKVTVTCKIHGDFDVFPSNFINGCGCPKCSESSLENRLSSFLEKNEIKYVYQKKFTWLKNKKPLSLDFFLPDYNIGIECQGEQHLFEKRCFENRTFENQVSLDKLKNNLCKEHGIDIVYYGRHSINTIDNTDSLYNSKNYFSSLQKLLENVKKQDIYIK